MGYYRMSINVLMESGREFYVCKNEKITEPMCVSLFRTSSFGEIKDVRTMPGPTTTISLPWTEIDSVYNYYSKYVPFYRNDMLMCDCNDIPFVNLYYYLRDLQCLNGRPPYNPERPNLKGYMELQSALDFYYINKTHNIKFIFTYFP